MKLYRILICTISIVFLTFSTKGQNNENDLIGTVWVNEVVKDACHDSLKFETDSTAVYYSCEITYSYQATYEKKGEKIEILILDNHLTPNLEAISKWILNLKNSDLEYFYIGQKSHDGFQEVDQKIYNQAGKFEKIDEE